MAWHEMERERRKIWRICANWECSGKEVEGDGRNGMGNVMRVCRTCFGPFWSGRVDEGNKKLVNKVVGVYFGQLTKGCGREFCENKVWLVVRFSTYWRHLVWDAVLPKVFAHQRFRFTVLRNLQKQNPPRLTHVPNRCRHLSFRSAQKGGDP